MQAGLARSRAQRYKLRATRVMARTSAPRREGPPRRSPTWSPSAGRTTKSCPPPRRRTTPRARACAPPAPSAVRQCTVKPQPRQGAGGRAPLTLHSALSTLTGMYSGSVQALGTGSAGHRALSSCTRRWERPGMSAPPPHTSTSATWSVHGTARGTPRLSSKGHALQAPPTHAVACALRCIHDDVPHLHACPCPCWA